MAGKPVMRKLVFILNLFEQGATENEILNEYKGLIIENINACFIFATNFLKALNLCCCWRSIPNVKKQTLTVNCQP